MAKSLLVPVAFIIVAGVVVFLVLASNRWNCVNNNCNKSWMGTYSSQDNCLNSCKPPAQSEAAPMPPTIVGFQCVQNPDSSYNCVSSEDPNSFSTMNDCVNNCGPNYVYTSPSYIYGGGYYGPRYWGGGGRRRLHGGRGGGGWRGGGGRGRR